MSVLAFDSQPQEQSCRTAEYVRLLAITTQGQERRRKKQDISFTPANLSTTSKPTSTEVT
jgi:hypothetical protein